MWFRNRFVLLLLTGLFLFAPVASGAVFRVGSGTGCTHTSLASAWLAATLNGPGQDEIRIPIGVQSINMALPISGSDLLISGGWASCQSEEPSPTHRSVISGNARDSVITISNGRRVELRQLTITNGGSLSTTSADRVFGGGVSLQSGTAILRGVLLIYNNAYHGGGLYATGTSSVMLIYGGTAGSQINYNQSQMSGGGIHVTNGATLRIENDNVAVTNNTAKSFGGGIFAEGMVGATTSVSVDWIGVDPKEPGPVPRGFLVSDNSATQGGGGMAIFGTAIFTGVETTIRNNTSALTGGGVFLNGYGRSTGASMQLTRRFDFLPAAFKACEGLYGCNQITGNTAKTDGAVSVMHGNLRLGQVLIAGNHSTNGGAAAIGTGGTANAPPPMNTLWLDSVVIAGNQCSGDASTYSPCSTLDLTSGPNQVHIQHVTLADNTLALVGAGGGGRREIHNGSTTTPLVLRSSIIEPQPGVPVIFSSVLFPIDADCVKAPLPFDTDTRALTTPAPYAFASRAIYDYRPASNDNAIDACDTSRLSDSSHGGVDLVPHGSVDDPYVPNRLGPSARADLGAFEVTPLLRDGFE